MAFGTGADTQKPVIGVTGNDRIFSPSWWCIKLAIYLAGGRATRISIRRKVPVSELDGIIISGGDDIHPSLFDAEAVPDQMYDEQRDELEQHYIVAAEAHQLPILGICRGHQLINVTFGGTLHTNIRKMRKLTYNRRGLLPTKTVRVKTDSKLASITRNRPFGINSLHYQAVDQLASGFNSGAEDLDGLVQSIEHTSRDILGVQWHPEYMFYLSAQKSIFRWLVQTARAEKKQHQAQAVQPD